MPEALPPTLQSFCAGEDLLRLAYLDQAGYPRVVPVWFVMFDNAYYVGTGTTSPKWKAMQRDARVGWVIDGGPRSGYKGASMRGRVEEVRAPAVRARIHEALGLKYYGTATDPKFIDIFGHADDPETVYLRLVPEGGLTWEY
jgi:nitroimidazol reductase NimA-like FMN-containing flavoprotein (pyridoxamine 5'-phosphate oxidase superfamily)